MTKEQVARNDELIRDIQKVGRYMKVENNPQAVEGLQKLIILLESWKED